MMGRSGGKEFSILFLLLVLQWKQVLLCYGVPKCFLLGVVLHYLLAARFWLNTVLSILHWISWSFLSLNRLGVSFQVYPISRHQISSSINSCVIILFSLAWALVKLECGLFSLQSSSAVTSALLFFTNGVVRKPNRTKTMLLAARPKASSYGTSSVDTCLDVFSAKASAVTNLSQLRWLLSHCVVNIVLNIPICRSHKPLPSRR